ncbi:Transcriptional regulatory protein, C terminal [Kosakonia arachidis]|uniref:Transcriptional regulatory protein, C terminal n=1 Tax=Kosakonia arachidis TaxID=551989 RepID=A0A1I6ZIX9_9ENTR|nr:winged helix-turn-helix domain-containing protein [Kosakonia arachidis]SFT62652.1 Transcriptional regulatory protein, C terminal [Kosakonia arachidis]
MIYTIDETITYNSHDCTLNHIPTEESLNLSISAGRLFEQLLNANGEILSRDTLLTEVWDKYGLRGSNSNLNQYLSILRKALAAFGCENLIITIPKIGIRLNADIKIEREYVAPIIVADDLADDTSAVPLADKQLNGAVLISSKATDNIVQHSFTATRNILFAVVALALMGSAVWYYSVRQSAELSIPSSIVKLAGGCEVVLLQGADIIERQSQDKQILQILSENNQSCVPGRRVYFGKITSLTTKNYGRTILSACKLNNSGHIISCDNFYYMDWRVE